MKQWADIRKKRISPKRMQEIKEELHREILEMDLRAIRELVGRTQEDLARAAKISQAELSRTERREDHLVSTLKRYVEALGGELEVVARFGDKTVRLRGV